MGGGFPKRIFSFWLFWAAVSAELFRWISNAPKKRILIAMVFKRHKNKHIDFILTFTVTAILHMVVAFLLIGKFAFVTK